MPLTPDPKVWFLSDLAAIEARIARNHLADLQQGAPLDFRDKRYRHLVENSLGLICTHDLEGIVLSVNPAAADSLGYEPRDGIGRNLRDFLSPETRHRFTDYLRRIKQNSRDSGLMSVLRKDGTERLWLYRNVLCAEPGERPYVLGHAIDVTERVAVEKALRRSQTQTLQATARLAGRVAHAFNNLLQVILGSGELLMADAGDELTRRAHLEAIITAATRGAAVTRQLLAVGGQQVIDYRVLDLNAIIAGLRPLFNRVAGTRVAVSLVLDPSLPKIEGDAMQIEQILLQLAANARDAMPDGGTLTISTACAPPDRGIAPDMGVAEPETFGWLTVRDTGVGMDAATRAHVFEPFFTTKSANLDVGLGLPTVYGIVGQLRGFVSVESELKRGTTITIALPRASAARESTEAPAQPVQPRTGDQKTIVLVDDEEAVRDVMQYVLRQKGYTVIEAASGDEAVRMLENHAGPVDLLLTDVVMPGMSGRELRDRLASRYPEMKVLYVSGYTDDAFDRVPGESAFLPKPFMLDALAKKVREVLA